MVVNHDCTPFFLIILPVSLSIEVEIASPGIASAAAFLKMQGAHSTLQISPRLLLLLGTVKAHRSVTQISIYILTNSAICIQISIHTFSLTPRFSFFPILKSGLSIRIVLHVN